VGPTGFAYGVDMTEEMLDLARRNAAEAGASNVEFVRGTIEDLPLPDASIDVVISNCVVNLSTDKPAVLAETYRVLAPGGRVGISDVVAEDDVTPAERAERGSYVGCIAGALSRREYLDGLAAAGFVGASVSFTHEVAPGLHGAIVRATKPAERATGPAVTLANDGRRRRTRRHRMSDAVREHPARLEGPVLGRLSPLDRFLPVWIVAADGRRPAAGPGLPGVGDALQAVQVGSVSLPIAVGLLLMMYPVLAKVRYTETRRVTGDRPLLIASLVLNWVAGRRSCSRWPGCCCPTTPSTARA
jgi:SAM-dependent methyltransferase